MVVWLDWVVGRIECTYEPAMTKAFLHGRTEAIRTVQPQSADFVRVCMLALSPSILFSLFWIL